MKTLLKLICLVIFLGMIVVTVRASLAISLWDVWDEYARNPWAVATLYDAYSGFTIFWLWVAYRERSLAAKVIWLILIYALGNIATAFYVLLQLMRLPAEEPASAILMKKPA